MLSIALAYISIKKKIKTCQPLPDPLLCLKWFRCDGHAILSSPWSLWHFCYFSLVSKPDMVEGKVKHMYVVWRVSVE